MKVPEKPHLETTTAPDRDLTPQEKKRVIAMVERIQQKRAVPAWTVWTALYRFVGQQVWQTPYHNQGG